MTARRTGNVFVVSGPSGVGKSTILRRVLDADPVLRFSISHTTRKPRPAERDGVDYFFVDVPAFEALVRAGAFLEHATYQGNQYGTSLASVRKPTEEGFDLILEVEIQGAQQLRARLPDAVRVFIEPPSLEVLENRLRNRSTETEDVLRSRLAHAAAELAYAEQCQYRIKNESVDKAVAELLEIICTERGERD